MKNLYSVGIIILLLLLHLSGISYARIEKRFEHLSEKDDLSNNGVLSIHPDREGFIWFGTWEVLNKLATGLLKKQ